MSSERKKYDVAYKATHKEEIRKSNREYYVKRRIELLEHQRTYRKRQYGIGVRDYWDLWEWQEGRCAVCWQPMDGNAKNNVDHEGGKRTRGDWTKVRGITHWRCNRRVSDSGVDMARKILTYLESPPAWQLWGREKGGIVR